MAYSKNKDLFCKAHVSFMSGFINQINSLARHLLLFSKFSKISDKQDEGVERRVAPRFIENAEKKITT